MAKFCTKCGKALGEGEICDCQSGVASSNVTNEQVTGANNQQTVANQVIQPQGNPMNGEKIEVAKGFMKNLFVLFTSILKKPVSFGSQYVINGERNQAFGLIGAQAIISALYALLMAGKMNSLMSRFWGGYSWGDDVKMPFVRIFLITVIVSFALACALAGIIFGVCTVFKNNLNYMLCLKLASLRSVITIVTTLAAVIISFFNPTYGVATFFMGMIGGVCYMMMCIPITSHENQDKVPVIMFLSIVLFIVVSSFIMSKCLPYYAPDSVRDTYKSISDMSFN